MVVLEGMEDIFDAQPINDISDTERVERPSCNLVI
jgi:hypothetical protein